jgi:hypothetical protein
VGLVSPLGKSRAVWYATGPTAARRPASSQRFAAVYREKSCGHMDVDLLPEFAVHQAEQWVLIILIIREHCSNQGDNSNKAKMLG